jgi:electron transfer flavoprotein alpha subunit
MPDANPKVWVYAEQEEGSLSEVALELLGKARLLARDLDGAAVGAVLVGNAVEPLAKDLFEHGADEVYLVEDAALEHYATLPYAGAVTDLVREQTPDIMIFGATTTGRDLAPRVASALRAGLTADCTDLQIGPHRDAVKKKEYEKLLYQIRPAFGGNIIATIVNPETRPQMATVREGVMKKLPAEPGRTGKLVRVTPAIAAEKLVCKLLERQRAEKKVNLKAAPIIVSGGAGVGGPDGFKLLADLAHAIGGVVGASRAAVDAGWIDHDHQVGQTGVTVRPRLYIACGISGAVQHRAGMQEAANIIAINKDPEAPIHHIAHYSIVGDLYQVIPMFITAYKEHVK